ncbi:DNA mismatch repair endonuclease MutL [Chloroflexota bacterium]
MAIKVLDKKVISQIAAGEIVERPAAVVKELLENSLDAGANQISVEVSGGGVSLIRVTDNGGGIPAQEIALAFERHATSKIDDIGDLESIVSLGFRGEALPSIAAAAQVEIVTQVTGETGGSYLRLRDGAVVEQKSQGRSQGTTVTASDLFCNMPARLKFLKSTATENSHIANVVSQYALAYPEDKFNLSVDGRATLRTSGSGGLIDSVIAVYGLEVARNMVPIGSGEREWESGVAASSLSVNGVVGSPAVSRANRGYLSFFVNRRWISSRLLAWAVEEAYHGLLMVGKHPIAVINISLPSREVDVNIHPTKTEIKFQNERIVFSAVQKAVRQSLIELTPVPDIGEAVTIYSTPSQSKQTSWPLPVWDSRAIGLPADSQASAPSLPALRVLGQLLNSYIIAEGPDGLYLIDQHAAHERILFEKIQRQSLQQAIEVQRLLEPATLEVNPQQEEVLKCRYEGLVEVGFSIEPFGDRTYLVRTVPALLQGKDWVGMVRELLDSLSGSDNEDWVEKAAISMACHGAVRAGQQLADGEMRELVRQLEQASLPHTCPHGRPTIIHLNSSQLRKEFGRS